MHRWRVLAALIGLVMLGWLCYMVVPREPLVPIRLRPPMALVCADWGQLDLDPGTTARLEGLPQQLRAMTARPGEAHDIFTIVYGSGADRSTLLLSRTWIATEECTMGGPQVEPIYRELESVLYTPGNLARAIEVAEVVTVVPQDSPTQQRELPAQGRVPLAEAVSMLGTIPQGESSEHEIVPYPYYVVQIRRHAASIQLEWYGRFVNIMELRNGSYDTVACLWDGSGRGRVALCHVAPVKSPQELEQPLRLFSCSRAITSGGPLVQQFDSDMAHTLAVIRCLVQARQAGKDSLAPPNEKPVIMDLFCGEAATPSYRVLLFTHGYALEGMYYQLDGIQLRILATINAG